MTQTAPAQAVIPTKSLQLSPGGAARPSVRGRRGSAARTPVLAAVSCQDIKTSLMQKIVNAAPTAGEGDCARRMISALVTAGVDAGYLVNSRLAKTHWQAADRPLPELAASTAGESAQWVDPAQIPSGDDVARVGKALAVIEPLGSASTRSRMATARGSSRPIPRGCSTASLQSQQISSLKTDREGLG